VQAQTYTNYEFIVVNDGSDDRSLEIMLQYAASDPRIVVLDKGHTGLTDSLNCGIRKARARWIARIDADDLCEPGRLKKQMSYLSRNPRTVLLGTGCIETDATGAPVMSHRYPGTHRRLVRRLERRRAFFPHSSAVFETSLAGRLGGYRAEYVLCEDLDLWLRLSEQGDLACLPDRLVRLRRHQGQLTWSGGKSSFTHLVYAAIVGHCLRRFWNVDPVGTAENADERRRHFFAWVDNRLREESVPEQRAIWARARSAYFLQPNWFLGAIQFGRAVLLSGYAYSLLVERTFGSGRPMKLAREWIKAYPSGLVSDPGSGARARGVERGTGGS
jgi:glycosyltransferase involved in cell wall biosynthesis